MEVLNRCVAGQYLEIVALIPAWQPDERFAMFVRQLLEAGFSAVLVLDDGSGPEFARIFEEVALLPGVRLLRHAVNLGKGRALKTGFNYFLCEYSHMAGIITADADGQHLVEDIVRVAQALPTSGGRVVLGSRGFERDVPLRSKLGNILTRQIFAFVSGTRLGDTQTGLRAFPRAILPELVVLAGERYEYEMTVLAHICRNGDKPLEVPIQTVYIDGNRSSHFNPVWDSMRIYFVLARFFSSSLIAAGIDFLGFSLTFALTRNVLLSVCVGRLSSLINYALNRRFVFHSRNSVTGTLLRYYLLVFLIGALSYVMIRTLTGTFHWNTFAAKIVVDAALSLVSFSVQRTFVFRRTEF